MLNNTTIHESHRPEVACLGPSSSERDRRTPCHSPPAPPRTSVPWRRDTRSTARGPCGSRRTGVPPLAAPAFCTYCRGR